MSLARRSARRLKSSRNALRRRLFLEPLEDRVVLDAYSAAVLALNPIVFFDFNENGGSTAIDSAAYQGANDGTHVGTVNYVSGRSGAAGDTAAFYTAVGGSRTTIASATAAFTNIQAAANNQVTVVFWQWEDPAGQPRADSSFSGQNAANQRIVQAHVPWSDNNVYWDAGNGTCCAAGMRLSVGTPAAAYEGRWVQWAFVKNGVTNVATIYRDGVQIANSGASTLDFGVITQFSVGGEPGGANLFIGAIDDFAVYDTALSGAQIQALYNAASGVAVEWDGGGDGVSWSDVNNWVGDTNIPDAANEIAVFRNLDPGLVNLNGLSYTIAGVQFAGTTGAFDVSNGTLNLRFVENTGTQNNTVSAGVNFTGSNITNSSAGTTLFLTGPVDTGPSNVTVNGAGNVHISGQITGANGIVKDDVGTLTLERTAGPANTYAGATTVNGGLLVAQGFGGDAVISGNITVNGGEFRLGSSNIIVNTSDITVNVGGVFNMNGQTDAMGNLQGGGNITNNSNGTGIYLDDLNGTHTFSGSITGGGGFVVRGNLANSGTQVLSSGTYTFGAFRIGRGTVQLTGGATVTSTGVTVGTNRTGSIGGITSGNATGILEVVNAGLTANWIDIGDRESGTVTARLNQSGGSVQTTGTSADNAGVRIGHWPSTNAQYNLSNGTLVVGNSRELSTAIDGTGLFNQTGGTATAFAVNVNSRNSTAGNGTFQLNGGVFNLGGGGIINGGALVPDATDTVNFGGGTLVATANWSSTQTINVTGVGGGFTLDTNGFNVVLSGNLSGGGGLTKEGAGQLTLSGTNVYTGVTIADGGTLLIAGTLTSNIEVNNGATLAGTGGTTGSVLAKLGSTFAPGASPGTFAAGGLTLDTGSTYSVEIDGLSPGDGAGFYDQTVVTGPVSISGDLFLTLNIAIGPGAEFILIDNDGVDPVTGTFNGLAEGSSFNPHAGGFLGTPLTISYTGGDGNDVVVRFDGDPVINGTGGVDMFEVELDGADIVVRNNAVEVFRTPVALLNSVTINGLAGDDTFDIINDLGSLAILNLNGGDDSDTFGANADIVLQSTTQVNIDGGDPTAPATPGDVLNLDLTGEPGPIIIDTVSGRIITGNGQASFSATNIETFNVTHDYGDVELEDGDLFVGGTDANDRIILSGSSEVDVRIGSTYYRDFTPTGRVVVFGGGGDDQIIANGRWTRDVYFDGGDGNDYLVAGGGDDELYGGAGNDRLYGGDGNDLIFGGAGNDTIDTGNGTRDEAHGEDGNDTILGGDGDDLLTGGAGNDSINGRYGNDLIFGGTGNDSLQGYHGDDIVVGGDGDDIVQGGDGDDIVVGGNSRDTVRGNGGNDVVAGGTSSVDAVNGPISPATRTALENALAAWIANGMAADLSFFSFADDGVEDQLYGDAGDDWFFSASPDRIRSV